MFNLKEQKDGSKFKKLVKGTENNKIVDLFTDGSQQRKPHMNPLPEVH